MADDGSHNADTGGCTGTGCGGGCDYSCYRPCQYCYNGSGWDQVNGQAAEIAVEDRTHMLLISSHTIFEGYVGGL